MTRSWARAAIVVDGGTVSTHAASVFILCGARNRVRSRIGCRPRNRTVTATSGCDHAGNARIAIVVHAALPDDPRVRRQAEALRDAGHEVDLFGLRDPGQPDNEAWSGMRIVRLPVRRR